LRNFPTANSATPSRTQTPRIFLRFAPSAAPRSEPTASSPLRKPSPPLLNRDTIGRQRRTACAIAPAVRLHRTATPSSSAPARPPQDPRGRRQTATAYGLRVLPPPARKKQNHNARTRSAPRIFLRFAPSAALRFTNIQSPIPSSDKIVSPPRKRLDTALTPFAPFRQNPTLFSVAEPLPR
jgi:hypothetical protein